MTTQDAFNWIVIVQMTAAAYFITSLWLRVKRLEKKP
jgi:hypothetical protein